MTTKNVKNIYLAAVFQNIDDSEKIDWMLDIEYAHGFNNLPLESLKKCISLSNINDYRAIRILNYIDDMDRYEAIYCYLVKIIYGLKKEMTLTEIVRNNYLIIDQYENLYKNEVTKMYGLCNKQQYYLREVNQIVVKRYNKEELIKINKDLLKIINQVYGKKYKAHVVKKIYDLFGENIWFLLRHQGLLDITIQKIDELSLENHSLEIKDMLAELQYFKFLKN